MSQNYKEKSVEQVLKEVDFLIDAAKERGQKGISFQSEIDFSRSHFEAIANHLEKKGFVVEFFSNRSCGENFLLITF